MSATLTSDRPLPHLLPLAELMWQELAAFGALSLRAQWRDEGPPNGFERFLDTRGLSTGLVFGTLEERAGLRFRDRVPFQFGAGDWDEARPLAGYTTEDGAPSPSEAAFSRLAHWRMVGQQGHAGGTWYRTLRSAVWLMEHRSTADAVHWSLDLLEHGCALDMVEVAEAMTALIAARSQAGTDGEAAARLRGGVRARTREELLAPELDVDGLHVSTLSDDMRALEMQLVERAVAAIGKVRAATTLDEWVLRLHAADKVCRTVQLVLNWTNDPLPLSLRALLSQLEEHGADTAAIVFNLELGSFALVVKYMRSIAEQYEEMLEGGWERRFRRERDLLPRVGDWLGAASVPPDWVSPSWRIAQPWTAWHSFEDDAMLRPRRWPGGEQPRSDDVFTEEPAAAERRQDFDERLGQLDRAMEAGREDEARGLLSALLTDYPWADPAWWQLALSTWRSGRPEDAIAEMTAALVLRPYEPAIWDGLAVLLEDLDAPEEASLTAGIAERLHDIHERAIEDRQPAGG